MAKLVVGPFNKGLRKDVVPFNVDNDAFPQLINAYQWRGRIKRKRGTQFVAKLQRFLGTTDGAGNLTVTISPHPIPTGISSFTVGSEVFVDPGGASPVTLLTNGPGSATLNRTTGVLTIAGSNSNTAVIFAPTLPVMGLRDFAVDATQFPGTIAFDTTYAYNLSTTFPYLTNDISFYKNPPADATNLPGYVPKGTWTPLWWNGNNYQQFWTVNYEGAFWATNGVAVPFDSTKIGMQFATITNVAIVAAGPPATADITIGANNLVVGDFVFINEVNGITGINWQTGYVITAGNPIRVEFPNATLGGAYSSGGIVQFLTNRSDFTKDCIRWYDGDPTDGNPTNPTFIQGDGWVNFTPPLSQSPFSIADAPPAIYYLAGARLIVPFKDRLLFFGPVIQTSDPNRSPIYLQDTVIYSQNGTPYYTASYTNSPNAAIDDPTSPTNVLHPLLVPENQTAHPAAYFEDTTGFGGFLNSGLEQPITSAYPNEDVLIVGFSKLQTRLVYSGNDIVPFNFYLINSELGTSSTFSGIVMDKGIISRGSRGVIVTSQTGAIRIDLDIPDQVFEFNLINNGLERVTAIRDYINEWIYLTYPVNSDTYIFPNQTLQYNYRDNSWGILNESYTTYGAFRPLTGITWATVGNIYPTWNDWNDPWNAGQSTLLQPQVIAGNQQGFVLMRDKGTGEGISLYIQNIVGSTVTSPNHTLNDGDYIIISGVLGALGSQVNGKIFSVVAPDANTFMLNPSIVGGSYEGGGVITRLYVPFIQTKQFPTAWELARKTRIGVQQYLLTTTFNSQITLLIYLSQDDSNAWNDSLIVPDPLSDNNSLIYSSILYTCPESTNLGLTPANTNLQELVEPQTGTTQQQQMWHRVNTSLLGDTVQLGFTMSDTQMRSLDSDSQPINAFSEIELHGFILDVTPSALLS